MLYIFCTTDENSLTFSSQTDTKLHVHGVALLRTNAPAFSSKDTKSQFVGVCDRRFLAIYSTDLYNLNFKPTKKIFSVVGQMRLLSGCADGEAVLRRCQLHRQDLQ